MADDIVKEAQEAFAAAQEAESDNRDDAREDIEFARLSQQWPEQIYNERQLEQRPCLTQNQLQPTIRQVVNDARMNRPATSIIPVDGKADKETAEVITGMIRNIETMSNADVAYDTAVEAAVAGGFGYWRIAVDYACDAFDEDGIKEAGAGAFDKSLFIRAIPNQFSIYGDPHSECADSSDWNQAHVVNVMTRDQFRAKYKGAEETDFDGAGWKSVSSPWRDGDSIQVAEYWKRERTIKQALAIETQDDVLVMMADEYARDKALFDQRGAQVIGTRDVLSHKVTQYILNGMEVLDTTEWLGKYIPIIPVYGDEVNLEGRRHFRSLIRDAKDPQRMLNYWITTATEQVALAPKAPYLLEEGALVDEAKWSTADRASHAYLEFKKGYNPPKRQMPVPFEGGIMQMAMHASDQIKAITGIYDASLGARSNETSGVAINARKVEGDVATFHFIDNLTRGIRHSGKVLLDLFPKVYTSPRIARILGEDGSQDEKPINQQFEDAQGIARIHDVRTGRYDVVVRAGPGFTTRREQAATQMMDLVRSFPDAAPVIGDLLARNLDWPGADEVAKRLEKLLPPGVKDEEGQIPPEVQQQMQQMGQALDVLKGELAKAQQQMNDTSQEQANKARELAIREYDAETKRITATSQVMGPEQIQAIVIQTLNDVLDSPVLPEAEGAAPYGQAA